LFIPLRLPAWFVLGLWFVLQWFYSAGHAVSGAGAVAYLAHVIGFLTGMALALLIRVTEQGRSDRRRRLRTYRHPTRLSMSTACLRRYMV
jgi:membrane associated rhomboid family serine protease